VTINTGLAVGAAFSRAAALGSLLLVPVSEAEMGTDLNGDGDMLDAVLHRIDTTTDVATNLMLAVVGQVLVSDRHFAFQVSEPGQGAVDLNGDGDGADAVWFIYDPAFPLGPANPFNTGLAALSIGLPGAGTTGGFVLLESEAATGADLNGDGDLLDTMGAVFDGTAFAVAPLVVGPHAQATPLRARNGRVLIALSEPDAGADINGDGDSLDVVLGAVDFNPGVPVFVPVGGGAGRAVANHPYALNDGAAVYFIDEASDGPADINADGDMTDAILAVFDMAGGSGEATPTGGGLAGFAVAGAPGFGLAVSANRVLFAISETDQAGTDLDGDMDTVDLVPAWVDTGPLTKGIAHIVPLALAVFPAQFSGNRALFAVSEPAMGAVMGVDLNGDGDTFDNVAHLLDTAGAGSTLNLGLAASSLFMAEPDALLGVSEAGQGGGDLNGDADAFDVVLRYFDLGDAAPGTRNLALIASSAAAVRTPAGVVRIALVAPEGQSAAFDDLNGDGDTTDTGLLILEIDPGIDPPAVVSPTPFFAGTASLFPTPPLAIGTDLFAFTTSETLAGADLNGDGDSFDTVLSYVRITPPSQP